MQVPSDVAESVGSVSSSSSVGSEVSGSDSLDDAETEQPPPHVVENSAAETGSREPSPSRQGGIYTQKVEGFRRGSFEWERKNKAARECTYVGIRGYV